MGGAPAAAPRSGDSSATACSPATGSVPPAALLGLGRLRARRQLSFQPPLAGVAAGHQARLEAGGLHRPCGARRLRDCGTGPAPRRWPPPLADDVVVAQAGGDDTFHGGLRFITVGGGRQHHPVTGAAAGSGCSRRRAWLSSAPALPCAVVAAARSANGPSATQRGGSAAAGGVTGFSGAGTGAGGVAGLAAAATGAASAVCGLGISGLPARRGCGRRSHCGLRGRFALHQRCGRGGGGGLGCGIGIRATGHPAQLGDASRLRCRRRRLRCIAQQPPAGDAKIENGQYDDQGTGQHARILACGLVHRPAGESIQHQRGW